MTKEQEAMMVAAHKLGRAYARKRNAYQAMAYEISVRLYSHNAEAREAYMAGYTQEAKRILQVAKP